MRKGIFPKPIARLNMGFNNSYLKDGEYVGMILVRDVENTFEKGVRRLLLEMEENEFKDFMSMIRYDRKRIRRSKKYWENKK